MQAVEVDDGQGGVGGRRHQVEVISVMTARVPSAPLTSRARLKRSSGPVEGEGGVPRRGGGDQVVAAAARQWRGVPCRMAAWLAGSLTRAWSWR